MWLINVVVIITFLLFIAYISIKAINKKSVVLFLFEVLAIIFECIFVIFLFKQKRLNNVVQIFTLVFSYIIPMTVYVIDKLNIAIKLNILYVVAKLSYALKKYEFTEGILKGAIKKDKTKAKYYYLRSRALEKLGNIPEARDMMFKVIAIECENKKAYFDLACLLDKENKPDTALVMLSQALKIDENYTDAKEMMGIIYSELGRLQEAKSIYIELIQSGFENYNTYYNLANICLMNKEYNLAIEYYLKTVELNNKCVEGYVALANIYYITEEYEKALEVLDKIQLDSIIKSRALYIKSMVYVKLGDNQSAIDSIRELIKYNKEYTKQIEENKVFENLMPEIYKISEELEENNVDYNKE